MFAHFTQINRYHTLVLAFFLLISSLQAQDDQLAADLYEFARELYLDSPEKAREYAQRAMDLALEESDLLTMGKSHFLLGYIYDYQEDVANAFQFYFGGIRVFRKLDEPFRVQQLYENLAYIAERKGVHTIAEQLRQDRMALKSMVDYRTQADMHYDLGLSFKHQGEFTKGIKQQLQALHLLERNPSLSDTTMYADIWLELGVLNYMQAKALEESTYLDSALQCYDRSVHFNGSNAIHLSKIQNNRGNIYRLRGAYDKSKAHLFESLHLAEGNDKLKIHTYYNLGRVYFSEGLMDSAILAFTRSLEINIDALGYGQAQVLSQNNVERSKAPELFGAVAYLDTLGIEDLEIRGRAMQHVFQMSRERYEIISASNNSMISQLYDQHRRELAAEERWHKFSNWGLRCLLLLVSAAAVWFWWKRYSVRQHNRRLAVQMEKRLKDKYGIELKE